ncbi:MAG: hypothetical protein FWH49_00200 [Clostridiales bacterium]|nr:hypothetical protein [Clostridiales bacterium]
MSFEIQKEKIKQICRELLEKGEVDAIIGYTAGEIEGSRIPYIFSKPEEADKLEWDERCTPNLCTYLHGRTDKVGIVAKPCDTRGIVNYLVENQLEKDKVYIIGVDCAGMKDELGEPSPGCGECGIRQPPLYDTRVENPDVTNGKDAPSDAADPADLMEKLERFQNELKKCILCFSCRQACYGCYCQVCFMDRGVPNWQPAAPDLGAKMVYHLGRAMHLSGRCVECGACERTCASGVNIRYLIKEISDFIEKTYGYKTGLDAEGQPVMASYAFDDREIGFLGGDADE